MGLTESWVFRPEAKPLCAIRRDDDGQWKLELLHHTGISCNILWLSADRTLEEAKANGEATLLEMGWTWPKSERVKSERKKEGKKWLSKQTWQ